MPSLNAALPAQGTVFSSFAEAELAIAKLSVEQGFCPGILQSDQVCMVWNCRSSKGCPWRARAWKGKNCLIKITRLDDNNTHNCAGNYNPSQHPSSSHEFLVKAISEHMLIGPKTPAKDIFGVLNRTLKISPSLSSIYKAKTALLSGLDNELLLQVQQIPSYLERVRQLDKDAVAVLDFSSPTGPLHFERCFIAPGSTRSAFPHLRPVLSLDGTFLKNKVKMTLLLAASFDADSSLVIVAWAIVQAESIANWTWFIEKLILAFPGIEAPGYTIISDRDKGLLHAVQTQLPFANHAYCCYHLAANVKTHFGQTASKYMWRLIYAPTPVAFDKALRDLRKHKAEAADYLCAPEQAHHHWATYCFPGRRFGLVTSNLAEVANALLVNIRALPLVDLLAGIWEHEMDKFYKRLQKATVWTGFISPDANRSVKQACNSARTLRSTPSSSLEGLVKSDSSCHSVHLPASGFTGECTCGKFQQMLLPCMHAAALAQQLRMAPVDFVHYFYTTEAWHATYKKPYVPISTDNLPVSSAVVPPPLLQKKGRRRTKRLTRASTCSQDNVRQENACSSCGESGHTRKMCINIYS